LLGRLMFVDWVTTNLSQRMAELLVQLYAPVTFIQSQHGCGCCGKNCWRWAMEKAKPEKA